MRDNINTLCSIMNIGQIDVDNFYNIEIEKDSVKFQGRYSSSVARELNDVLGSPTVDGNGYIKFAADGIRVILT